MTKLTLILSALALAISASARAQISATITWPLPGVVDSGYRVTSATGFSIFGNVATIACQLVTIDTTTGHPKMVKPIFLRSDDGGRDWRIQDPGLSENTNAIFPHVFQIDSLNAIASSSATGLYRATDGQTWAPSSSPANGGYLDINYSDPSTGIAVTGQYIFTTSDGGLHWDSAQIPMTTWPVSCHSYGNGKYRVFAYAYGTVYTTYDNWRTHDSTAPAVPHGPGYPDIVLGACNFSSGDTMFAYGNEVIGSPAVARGLIMRSTDAGRDWSKVGEFDTLSKTIKCMSSADRDTILAGTAAGLNKVLVSFDHGASWAADTLELHEGLNLAGCYGLAFEGSGSIVGCFTSGLSNLVMIRGTFARSGVSPQAASATYSITPNPASQIATIRGLMPNSEVEVVDLLGRCVLRQHDEDAGEVTLDLSSLPPSVYYVHVQNRGTLSVTKCW